MRHLSLSGRTLVCSMGHMTRVLTFLQNRGVAVEHLHVFHKLRFIVKDKLDGSLLPKTFASSQFASSSALDDLAWL